MSYLRPQDRIKTWAKKQGQEAIITGTERWWNNNVAKIMFGVSALVALSRVFGLLLSFIIERALKRYRHKRASADWKERNFYTQVQGALYSVDTQKRRIEKRTLFLRSLDQVLGTNVKTDTDLDCSTFGYVGTGVRLDTVLFKTEYKKHLLRQWLRYWRVDCLRHCRRPM